MVYLWKIPDDYPEKLIGEYDRKNSPDRFLFKKGEKLPSDLVTPVIKFNARVEALREYDDLANSAMIPVISERLASVLAELAPDDIQLFDVVIEAKDGKLDGYKILNITTKVSGIDKEQSKFTFVPGSEQIMSFQLLIYKENCMNTHQLGRDADYSSNLIVSERLADDLTKINAKGVGLYLPEDI